MSVEVVIPWQGGCPHRQRALATTLGQYGDWPVVVSPIDGPWIKARAVTPALEASSADIAIVADADCQIEHEALAKAVDAVEDGAAWAIPHRWLLRLTKSSTARCLKGEPWSETEERPRVGWEGGGFVIGRPADLLDVPLDPRFIGWGGEDESWALALRALVGAPWRGRADLRHLWHPPQPRRERRIGSAESMALVRRYAAARSDPDRMRELIEEAKSEYRR